jgi:hypothetical protein
MGTVFILSSEEFLDYVNKLKFSKEERPFTSDQYEVHYPILEPQERDIDIKGFQQRLAQWFVKKNNGVKLDTETIKRKLRFFNTELKYNLEKCTDVESARRTLETVGLGYDYIPVSVAKRLLPKLLSYYKIN